MAAAAASVLPIEQISKFAWDQSTKFVRFYDDWRVFLGFSYKDFPPLSLPLPAVSVCLLPMKARMHYLPSV